METKNLSFKVKNIHKTKDGFGMFRGYASVFDVVDAYNEVVERGALENTLRETSGLYPLCWGHDPKLPMGVVAAEEDEKGLDVIGQLNLDVQLAREKYALMEQESVSGLSIGFKTLKDAWEGDIRKLKEVKLYEVSLITRNFQAQPQAVIETVKERKEEEAIFEIISSFNKALRRLEKSIGKGKGKWF